jgi:PTS system nitrogen regulatory IIA component
MYLNLTQIAESFGVSERVAEDWVQNEGLPYVFDRGYLVFDRAQVVKWATGRGLLAKAGFLATQKATFTTSFALVSLLRAGGIWRDVAPDGVLTVFEQVLERLPSVAPAVRKLLVQRLHAPGGITWAPVGSGIALPHFSSHVAIGRDSGCVALLFLRAGLPLATPPPDGVPVTRLLFFVPPSPRAHLDVLGRLSKALIQGPVREHILRGAPDEPIFAALAAVDAAETRAEGKKPS